MTILSVNISDIAIITVNNVDYRCIITNISKFEAIDLLENSVLGYIYIKNIFLIFSLFKAIYFYFFLFFCFIKMVDSEYNMDIYKSVKVSTGTVTRIPEMLKLVSDHLKTKKCVSMQDSRNVL